MPLSKITRLRGGTNNSGPATLAMQGASGDGAGFVHTEVFGIAGIAAATGDHSRHRDRRKWIPHAD